MSVNKHYKDSLFSLLFSDPVALRELYGALEGVTLSPNIPIILNTLEDVLYMTLLNDLSFVVGNKLVVLIEHQSTINPNMALRLLLYIARIYEKISAGMEIYGKKRLSIPRPEFIVLYNGAAPYPDMEILQLSDMFENTAALGISEDAPPPLELIVKVYNINQGHNEEITGRCKTLREYSLFIAKAREFGAERAGSSGVKKIADRDREAAIEQAIRWCIAHGILHEFLTVHGAEVTNMLMTEWKLDDVLAVWGRQSREEGIEIGREKGKEEILSELARLLKEGKPVDEAITILKSGVYAVQ